jgi:hypothetical protein
MLLPRLSLREEDQCYVITETNRQNKILNHRRETNYNLIYFSYYSMLIAVIRWIKKIPGTIFDASKDVVLK